MDTEKTRTDGGTASVPTSTVVLAGIGLACVTAVASLARWSGWWPHSDMRQIWANGLTVLGALVGLATLVVALRRLDDRRRWLLVASAVVAAVVGSLGGFALLRSATADLR